MNETSTVKFSNNPVCHEEVSDALVDVKKFCMRLMEKIYDKDSKEKREELEKILKDL